MIKHVVAFTFKPEVGAEKVAQILAELDTFPARYGAMRDWSAGQNISTRDQTFTHVFSVEFAAAEELLAYLHSESHEAFVRERWRPVIARQAIVSYEY